MISEYLLTKLLDVSFNALKETISDLLKKKHAKLISTKEDVEQSLRRHLRSVDNWSSIVSFNDIKRAKATMRIFIELELFISPQRIHLPNEHKESIPLQRIFDISRNHVILLGQPGAGKTTSMKYLCQLLLHEDDFQSERFSFPILIRLRDLNNKPPSSSSQTRRI